MNFPGGINCPPYETADGFLTTTEGCSHNTCLFCIRDRLETNLSSFNSVCLEIIIPLAIMFSSINIKLYCKALTVLYIELFYSIFTKDGKGKMSRK